MQTKSIEATDVAITATQSTPELHTGVVMSCTAIWGCGAMRGPDRARPSMAPSCDSTVWGRAILNPGTGNGVPLHGTSAAYGSLSIRY
jgi:hypothetical protein